jgi:hypothetical protein
MVFGIGRQDKAGVTESSSWDDSGKTVPHPLLDILLDTRFECVDEDDVPGIEVTATTSFSPTSVRSLCSSSSMEQDGEAGNHFWTCTLASLLVEPSPHKDKDRDYISKEELQVLLPARFMEDFEDLVARSSPSNDDDDGFWSNESATNSPTASSAGPIQTTIAERELRREMIQVELDHLVKGAEDLQELEEIEPEAVEALGIAANRLAYRQRYYNVASCRYVYVPSVAYCLLEGCLLEEAAKHYFGQSDEFLVKYAAGLGSTILAQHRHQDVVAQDNHSEAEDVDWSDDDDLDNAGHVAGDCQSPGQIANQVWGWSPRSRVSRKGFDFVSVSDKSETQTGADVPQKIKNSNPRPTVLPKIAALLFLFMAFAIARHFWLLPVQQHCVQNEGKRVLTAAPITRPAVRKMKSGATVSTEEPSSLPDVFGAFQAMVALSNAAAKEAQVAVQVESAAHRAKQTESIFGNWLEASLDEAEAVDLTDSGTIATIGPMTSRATLAVVDEQPRTRPIVLNLLY